MSIFDFSNPDLYFLFVLSLVNAVMLCFLSYKFMQIIQIEEYKVSHYNIWLRDTKAKWVSRILMLSILSFLCAVVTNVLFNEKMAKSKIVGYIGLLFYFGIAIKFIIGMYKIPQKKPLKLTKRMFRLFVLAFILYLAISFVLLLIGLQFSYYLRASLLTLTPITIPVVVPFVVLISAPIEKGIYNFYKSKTKRTLASHKDLIKIGITGSFGKTSTKQYLTQILQSKYKVLSTPGSFNTPMGIAKVTKNLTDDTQIFVVEMGAKQQGDIAELCKMVGPTHGMITAVGEQHLETFKSLDNIIKTKSELFESLSQDAICVFDCSNPNTKKMFDLCKLKRKIAVGTENGFLQAKNIVASADGLSFDMIFKKRSYPVKTQILGEHNIQNILLASAMALKLGVNIKMVQKSIAELKPVEHRLELKKLPNDILMIDDSFNSNIQGTAVALKTLGLFTSAKRKIVVTPGLVELGDREAVENQELGRRIAKIADVVILVNKNQSDNIRAGLVKENFDQSKIIYKDTLFDVTNFFKTFLQSGDVILMENDLPDNYK